jgi:acyl carrier protein
MRGLAIDVSDRFGQYGLVGLVLFSATPDALHVDTFLLSCRALGRGVEHRIVAELAQIAKSMGLGMIRLRLEPTPKNQPARDFVEGELSPYAQQQGERTVYQVPVEVASAIRYRPGKATTAPIQRVIQDQESAAGEQTVHATRAEQLAWIVAEMVDADKIAAAIKTWKRRQRPEVETSFISPRTDLERALARLWAEILGLEKVGVQDNFFELGGDSLAMVRVNIRIYETLGIEFPLEAFFEQPTIEAHAVKIAALVPAP